MLVEELAQGIAVDGLTVYAKTITVGRFIEESNVHIYVRSAGNEAYLMMAKIFRGRKPHYLPWVELFSIGTPLHVGGYTLYYFDSSIEDCLLTFFGNFLDPAGRIFIEYVSDEETFLALQSGVPPALTRLGSKLLRHGFTWFKDWYFAEGMMEGGPKLQGEKPPDNITKNLQIKRIREETELFLLEHSSFLRQDLFERNAFQRAKMLLGD